MSYKNITAGTKTARAVAARFIQAGENKTPAIEISFEFEEANGMKERLAWQGWLTTISKTGGKGALEQTMKTLVEVLEFNGNEAFNPETGVLTDPNVLNYAKDVQIVVDMEVNPNDNKSYPRIKWVNNLSGSNFGTCEPEIVKSALGAIGFKAAYLAAKQKAPHKSAPAKVEDKKLPF